MTLRNVSDAAATILAGRHAETRRAARRALSTAARAYVLALDAEDKAAFSAAKAALILAASSGDL